MMSWKVVRTNGLAFNSPFAPHAVRRWKTESSSESKGAGWVRTKHCDQVDRASVCEAKVKGKGKGKAKAG